MKNFNASPHRDKLIGDSIPANRNVALTENYYFATIDLPVTTIIEIKHWRNGWKVFECAGVEPVFLVKDQALSYAKGRASFRSGEIRVLDSAGSLQETINFNDADRKL